MRRIVLFNSAVNSSNHGDRVIVEAVRRELNEVLRGDFVCEIAPFDASRDARLFIREAAFCIQAGTNLLVSDLERKLPYPDWAQEIRNLILCGVGWGDYQRSAPTAYTRRFYRDVLGNGFQHSVRDTYTASKLSAYHVPVINTGCPTTWQLDETHCRRIPEMKGRRVVFTVTKFKRHIELDRLWIGLLRRHYQEVYFWPAQFEDADYVRELGAGDVILADPSLSGLDTVLNLDGIDYVGTRLHAGIRALQHARRTLILGIDNRAPELSADYRIPVLPRTDVGQKLPPLLEGRWPTRITLNEHAVRAWKSQLIDRAGVNASPWS